MRLFNFHEIVAHIFVGTIFELDAGELCLYAFALCVLLLSCPPRSAVSPAALSVCARSRKKKRLQLEYALTSARFLTPSCVR